MGCNIHQLLFFMWKKINPIYFCLCEEKKPLYSQPSFLLSFKCKSRLGPLCADGKNLKVFFLRFYFKGNIYYWGQGRCFDIPIQINKIWGWGRNIFIMLHGFFFKKWLGGGGTSFILLCTKYYGIGYYM